MERHAHRPRAWHGAECGMTATPVRSSTVTWQVLSVVAYLGMVAMNGLANYLPLFGRDTGEVSDRYPSLFTPAGYTFSIWGLIYLLLAAFVVYQALPRTRGDERVARARPLFVLSSILNVAWLVTWHGLAIPLSEVVMLALLGTLIALYLRVDLWRAPAPPYQRWVLDLPFALYLGWISVATIANTSIFLLDLGFDGGDAAVTITAVMVVVAAVLGLLALLTRRDWAYALVIAWGLGGVASARAGEVPTVSYVALVCVIVLGLLAALAMAGAYRSPGGPNGREVLARQMRGPVG